MSKKQFTLDSWLKDKSQKVVTRCGFPVRIVCTDVKRKDYPILALVEKDDQEEYQSFTKDGRFSLNFSHDIFDLFIETADEVSEDEKIRNGLVRLLKELLELGGVAEDEWDRNECEKYIAWLEKQGQVKESTISQHEIETCKENNNSLTSEDEKIRKEIINYFQCQSEEEPTRKEIHNKWIAWLENIPYTIDHEKREGFHLGYKACLEKQGKQKFEMKTAEESLGIDSDTYNKIVDACIFGEQKPNPCDGCINRKGCINCENGELREAEQKSEENKGNVGGISPNQWKPSEDDIIILEKVFNGKIDPKDFQATLSNVLEQLKKLKEGNI